jgi:hypothetical protein
MAEAGLVALLYLAPEAGLGERTLRNFSCIQFMRARYNGSVVEGEPRTLPPGLPPLLLAIMSRRLCFIGVPPGDLKKSYHRIILILKLHLYPLFSFKNESNYFHNLFSHFF